MAKNNTITSIDKLNKAREICEKYKSLTMYVQGSANIWVKNPRKSPNAEKALKDAGFRQASERSKHHAGEWYLTIDAGIPELALADLERCHYYDKAKATKKAKVNA